MQCPDIWSIGEYNFHVANVTVNMLYAPKNKFFKQ